MWLSRNLCSKQLALGRERREVRRMPTWWLAEISCVYLVAPLVMDQLAERGLRYALMPGMWLVAAVLAWRWMQVDPTMTQQLWQLPSERAVWVPWLLRTAIGVAVLAGVAYWLAPDRFLALPRKMFGLWLLVAVLYPMLSVVPQGFIFRGVWANVYAPQLHSGFGLNRDILFTLGVAAFTFAHVIFRNPTALVATAVGGALFLYTYRSTGSLMLSNLEHAIYGMSAFTFGLGEYLYLGATRR